MKQIFEDGLHNISNDEYHASEGISRSMLMSFNRSARHYWYDHVSGLKQKESATPAMNIGSAVHTLVLEPHLFDTEFFITTQQTKPRRDTNPYFKMMDEAAGRIILTPDEFELSQSMSVSVRGVDEANMLLSDCNIEDSIYFTHESTGIQCKVRPDAWSGSLVCDLKTTVDASLRAFQGSAVHYGYFLQAGMNYCALKSLGIKMEKFAFIVVEKAAPYATAIYILTDEALDYGINQFNALMIQVAECHQSNQWPSYGIRDCDLPKYLKFDSMKEFDQ
jgi:exodeoxyribonuclease VIII